MEGLEPPHPFGYQILSLARLPFRHIGTHELPTTDVSNGKYYARTEGKGKAIRKRKPGSDFIAPASYRVTGNAVAKGEAAGATAAVAAQNMTAPHDVLWNEVKPVLRAVRNVR